jgi:hypothetical protein
MNPLCRSACLLGLLAGAFAGTTALAQDLRDPTIPPAQASQPLSASATDVPWDEQGVAVVVRDGKSFLVNGTRLYGVGQSIGAYRIVQIAETEIWLRKGKELLKLPRFTGIERKPSAESKGSTP